MIIETKRCFELIHNETNDLEIEQEFQKTCLSNNSQSSEFDQPFSKNYQEYMKFYHQKSSVYLIKQENNKTKLHIYDTEREIDEVKVLETPKQLDIGTCIAQLPNGELFCYGSYPGSGSALIIERNYELRILPSGVPCYCSSAIYLNGSIYCFGGKRDYIGLALSMKFNLNQNRWMHLAPMPRADGLCSDIKYNGNILISGYYDRNILLYSVDINSFSRIPYQFAPSKRKILINAKRLYLIECSGLIYESNAEDEYIWSQISNSIINQNTSQVFCSYNKGGIYIATNLKQKYYKFDLRQKIMLKL